MRLPGVNYDTLCDQNNRESFDIIRGNMSRHIYKRNRKTSRTKGMLLNLEIGVGLLLRIIQTDLMHICLGIDAATPPL